MRRSFHPPDAAWTSPIKRNNLPSSFVYFVNFVVKYPRAGATMEIHT